MFIKDPNTRKWIYGIVAAAIPVLVILGFVGGEDMQVWLNFSAAVLGLGTAGLAVPNTAAPATASVTVAYAGPDPVTLAQEVARRIADEDPKHRA